MSLILRGQIGRRLSISEMDGNFTYLQQLALSGTTSNVGTFSNYSQVTYSELKSSIESSDLNPGSYYLITDFKTCYDQPDYDVYGNPITEGNYKVGNTHSILVFATSENTLAPDAWQPDFPKDKLKYDYSWTQSEVTGGTAYGRITERIDEFNNRTDYDHRDILFKRYDTFAYPVNSPQAGTISVAGGVVTGNGTSFTNFSPGDVIAIPDFSEVFFKINTISSATAMSLTGSVWNVTGNDIKYYSIDYTMDRCSYKRNNVDSVSYEISTFGDEFDAVNNYIGDHANSIEGVFLLSNNVFLNGPYINNKFGNNCFDNTFDDDCSNNTIGNFFNKNITDDDFDGNNIGNYFESNLITSEFRRNVVGEYFRQNYITEDDFYRNRIGEYFEYNKISGDEFQNNIIGNAFNNNQIDSTGNGFLKNIIGVGFNNNIIDGEFNSNTFGNGTNYNRFYGDFYENKIGDYFEDNSIGTSNLSVSFYQNHISNDFQNNNVFATFYNNRISNDCYNNNFYSQFYRNDVKSDFNNNTVGDSENIDSYEFYQNIIGEYVKSNLFLGYVNQNTFGNNFYSNQVSNSTTGNIFGDDCIFNNLGENFERNSIGGEFYSNNIGHNFSYNQIGSYFNNNEISNDFGYGGGQVYGNRIGNYFEYNNIGEYFYSNSITDLFSNNDIGHYFRFNDVKVHDLNGIDFLTGYQEIISFTSNIGATISGIDGSYTGLTYSDGGGPQDATFDVTVSSSVVSNVSLNFHGYGYQVGDQLTIPYQSFGGTAGYDIVITVGSVSGTPLVYGDYNKTIFQNSAGVNRLSYYDGNDVLNITDITSL